jgi:prepilin-type N-terminal cleavage/methylation domain-containing protein
MQTSRRSGFSMVELAVTITILGIVVAIGAPKLDTNRLKSDAALRAVSMQLMLAQRTALQKQCNVIVSFDAAQSRVIVTEDRNNSETFDAGDVQKSTAFDAPAKFVASPVPLEGLSNAISLARPRVLSGLPSVIFRRNGAASSDVSVFLTAKTTDLRALRGITVTQSTGRVESFKFNGTAWVRVGA